VANHCAEALDRNTQRLCNISEVLFAHKNFLAYANFIKFETLVDTQRQELTDQSTGQTACASNYCYTFIMPLHPLVVSPEGSTPLITVCCSVPFHPSPLYHPPTFSLPPFPPSKGPVYKCTSDQSSASIHFVSPPDLRNRN
jgi:hypothetical protein